MSFLWPHSLWLLLLVPATAAGYRLLRKTTLITHRGLEFSPPGAARHAPPALFALAMVLLLTATARPTAFVLTPMEGRTVILAIDVSGSMSAEDVTPTRLDAAKAAARDFVSALPASARIGIVAFSDEAQLVQAPVADRGEVLFAIDSLQTQNGTAIGRGIIASLEAAFPDARFELAEPESAAAGSSAPRLAAATRPRTGEAEAAIILLTDGQNSHGPNPLDVAPLAAERGVRIYTVGVGTSHGEIRDARGFSAMVGIDEETLLRVAGLTGGEYFYASSAPDLRQVYSRLSAKVVLTRIQTEITALLCAAAALVATVSAAMSLLWFGRVL
jgi:Ca-activated chloride channel family protein